MWACQLQKYEKIVNTYGNSKFNADLTAYTTAANSDWVKDQSSLSFVARAPEMTIRIAPKKSMLSVTNSKDTSPKLVPEIALEQK